MTVPNSAVIPPAPGAAGVPLNVQPGQPAPAAAAPAAPAQPAAQPQVPPQPGQAGVPPVVPGAKPDSVVPLSALHEERTKRQALASEMESLKAELDRLKSGNQVQAGTPPPQEQGGITAEQVEKLWEEDPKQAVRTEIMLAFNWYDRINSGLESYADQFASQNPDFNTVRGQVMNHVRSMPVEARSPKAIQDAYMYVRGQNVDAIIKQREQEWMAKMTSPAGFQAPTAGTYGPGVVTQPGQVTLTDEQLRVAEAMGLSPESYARGFAPKVGR